ncbi:CBS domain-containing protein CBSX2, chloroplastic [Capsicum chinense]|nr:CBS domain-containing protein CBSX1, chloroplastic [Capsicum annuum]KAF3614850.1 CBS domain-containing protein CBSX2, chloroplastic [Capsicum annuum]KAF3617504.1 CBS domain-containing protein CBSX2, chloroplastic [Capsicum annuum]PHU10444.1 CBS domain-containing protein CBSX2, chloroplastic [Capsicum chinense]
MDSVLNFSSFSPICVLNYRLSPATFSCPARPCTGDPAVAKSRRRQLSRSLRAASFPSNSANGAAADTANSQTPRDGNYSVGDFMTRKEDLHVVKTTTKVGEALEMLVEKRVTGLPVVDDDWNLVGVVSDYDLLALDSISGAGQADTNLFPDVDSTWKTFNEVQKLLSKTNGKVVGDVMTPTPLSIREDTNLEDAARLLLQTKYRRLPVVDGDGKLVGIITRGNVVRAALQIKRTIENIQ